MSFLEPTLAPQDVRSSPAGSSSIIVSWNKWKSVNEDDVIRVQGYNIAYRVFQEPGDFTIKYIDAVNQSLQKEKYKLVGLRKLTKYEIKVQAVNKGGRGPFSDPIIGETLNYDAPSAPLVNILKSTQSTIEINWTLMDNTPILGKVNIKQTITTTILVC